MLIIQRPLLSIEGITKHWIFLVQDPVQVKLWILKFWIITGSFLSLREISYFLILFLTDTRSKINKIISQYIIWKLTRKHDKKYDFLLRVNLFFVKLTVFHDMVGNMESNTKVKPIVTELFIRGRNPGISLFFLTQSYFTVPENIRLNATHSFVMKILTKENLNKKY